jgi:hypothetical protein
MLGGGGGVDVEGEDFLVSLLFVARKTFLLRDRDSAFIFLTLIFSTFPLIFHSFHLIFTRTLHIIHVGNGERHSNSITF